MFSNCPLAVEICFNSFYVLKFEHSRWLQLGGTKLLLNLLYLRGESELEDLLWI